MVARDPLADKRQRLAELMNQHLASAYRFNGYMDSSAMRRSLERGRDYYSADMPEIKRLSESQLDELLRYYGAAGGIVW